MKKIWVITAAWMLVWGNSLHADEAHDQSLSLKERVAIASRIYADIQIYFGHWQGIPDFDLSAEYGNYLDKVLATNSRRAFDLASMEFMAKLQNSHSGFVDHWLQQTYGQQLNFYAYPIDGQWVVTRSEVPDLKVGDVISALDGDPFASFYQNQRKYISASDEQWRQRSFFEYPYLFPESFQLTLNDGRRVTVHRKGPFRFAGTEYTKIDVSDREGIPVIRVPSFDLAKLEADAVGALKQAGTAKAIIIDVRDNHGGSTPQQLMDALMDRPYRWWSESTPAHIGSFQLENSPGTHTELHWFGGVEQPSGTPYKGVLFLLTNGGCFSACEDFVVSFKDNHRATIIGERTAGSSGQPYSHRFENGMGFGLSTKREFMPDGSPFEGVGIAPDIEMQVHAADLASGRDPVLEKALSLAKSASSQ
jgi:carboxyl-terminal processing protease